MIRLIVRVANHAAAANVGGPVDCRHYTFDVGVPDLEKLFRNARIPRSCVTVEVIGAEWMGDEAVAADAAIEEYVESQTGKSK